jgi:signal transduction histidine kinase
MTAVLLILLLIMTRRWLIRPVDVLKRSAEVIGEGDLSHRVPLQGVDELAQLARHLDSMAEGLARHQQALLEARELSAIGELCANVAHGLRNPLAAIRTSAQLAERRAERDNGDAEVFRELANEADRMDQRITRLFEFSKPRRLEPVKATFATLASDAAARARPLLQVRDINLTIEDLTEERLWVLDNVQLAEALAELITNAAHHSSAGSTIMLRGETLSPDNGSGHRLRMHVIDEGKGMSVATLEKAFDLFFTSRPEGTGMGLALAHRIARHHQGELTLQSAPGAGTSAMLMVRNIAR